MNRTSPAHECPLSSSSKSGLDASRPLVGLAVGPIVVLNPDFASACTLNYITRHSRAKQSEQLQYLTMLPFRFRRRIFGDSSDAADTDSSKKASSTDKPNASSEATEVFPDLWDVLKVRYLLQWKVRDGFPPELVDEIIDAAEYWPSVEHHMKGTEKRLIRNDRDQVLLKTVPLCYDRKVTWLSRGFCDHFVLSYLAVLESRTVTISKAAAPSHCPSLPQDSLQALIA